MNSIKLLTAAAIACMFSSCATLLSPKSNKGAFIQTNVGEAKIFDSKNRVIGTTPYYYEPKVNGPEETLTIEKEGYKPQTVRVALEEQKGFAFLDAMFLCIPCLVDYPTKNIYRINQDSFNLKLVREYPKDVDRVNILFNEVTWSDKDGATIGKELNEPAFFRKSFFDSYLYKSEVCAGSGGSRYQVLNCSRDDDENKLLLNNNTIEVKPLIKSLKINTSKIKDETWREISMEVVWQFTKRSGAVIKEVPATLKERKSRVENKPLIASMLRNSFTELMDNDDTYKFLLEESKVSGGPGSTYNSLTLEHVKVPAFNRNRDLIQYLMKGVVTVKHDDGHGSAFLISKDGYLLTNYHVIKDKKSVNVQFSESLTLTADVIRGDDRYDVALLKINGSGFTALEVLNSDSALAGEDVFAIGTPEDVSLGQSVTKGVLSGKRKIAEKIYLQTDVSINSGNSGGPLLNEDGKVIGIVSMKLTGKGIEGLGFCVPTNTILEVLNIQFK
ncbi:MAG: trypsin-like peptidase domain-containing protein [Bacteroidota bacterium]